MWKIIQGASGPLLLLACIWTTKRVDSQALEAIITEDESGSFSRKALEKGDERSLLALA